MKFNENCLKGSGDKEGARKCYGRTDRLTEGLTEEGQSYNPPLKRD